MPARLSSVSWAPSSYLVTGLSKNIPSPVVISRVLKLAALELENLVRSKFGHRTRAQMFVLIATNWSSALASHIPNHVLMVHLSIRTGSRQIADAASQEMKTVRQTGGSDSEQFCTPPTEYTGLRWYVEVRESRSLIGFAVLTHCTEKGQIRFSKPA